MNPWAKISGASTAILLAAIVTAAPAAALDYGKLEVRGGEMRDGRGRIVLLRGVNFPWGLRVPAAADEPPPPAGRDAAMLARLGFNVARVQLSWKAIEPGTAGPNDPAICSPGSARDPGQWDARHARRYLDRVERVVDALHRHGVGTLFQIAQYGYSDRFGGPPSHPDWAVCTDGLPITSGSGALAYLQPGVSAAANHFWLNDVRGDLQGEYARMLEAIARRFADHPGVAGYELYNEPFHPDALSGSPRFDALVQCFYAGRSDPGLLADGSRPRCPPGVPSEGALQAIRRGDPSGIVHPQAHIFTNFGVPTRMGPLPARNLVFNFHVYCLSEVLTQPARHREPGCAEAEEHAVAEAAKTRRAMASDRQPGALGWFLSEFGYTRNEDTLRHMTTLADRNYLGWTYFLWRADRGFSRSTDNPGMLRAADGTLRSYAPILARPYPSALAGRPITMSYDAGARRFALRYRPRSRARSLLVLPRYVYGRQVCHKETGATARLAGDTLMIRAARNARTVAVTVSPTPCQPLG
jgi:endoglycosylceramidase